MATRKVDDWAPDTKQPLVLKMPSFIRLFVMDRILENYSGTIETLLNESNIDKAMHDTAKDILSLLHNASLKIYMEKHYNENKQAEIIEMIFNQIILKKFAKEYENVAKYTSSSNNKNKQKKNEDESKHDDDYTDYQTLFNTTDVMCSIFQFLVDFDRRGAYVGEISNCSLVCSQWLYHAFNPKSAYYLHLLRIACETASNHENVDRNVTRAWQRLWNVREIYFDLEDVDPAYLNKTPNLLLNKLSMLRNVEKIDCESDYIMEYFSAIKLILKNCKEKLRSYSVQLDQDASDQLQDVLPPLVLNNAQEICTDHTYFSIIWSKKLETLNLAMVENINDQWCDLVINKCDCSGIKQLAIADLTFDKLTMNVTSNKTQLLLTKLANKFTNIEYLYIAFFDKIDDCVLLFWKLLHNTMLNNNINSNSNTCTELQLPRKSHNQEYKKIVSMIEKYNPQVNKINIDIDLDNGWLKQKVSVNKIIGECSKTLEYIAINDWARGQNSFRSIVDELKLKLNLNNDQISKFKIVELNDWNENYKERLNDIKNVLEWEMILKQGIIVLADVHMCDKKSLETFKPRFEPLCDRVFVLMNKQIGFNLSFTFVHMDENCCDYIDKCLIDFEKNRLLKEYKMPQCNKIAQKYVEPLGKPILSFKEEREGSGTYTFHVANATTGNRVLL